MITNRLANVTGQAPDARSLRLWLAWGAGALLATTVVHVYDPNMNGSYGLCPLRWATGQLCAFCGATRAVHALTHGDLGTAWGLNPLIVVLIPVAFGLWVYALWRAVRGRGTDYLARTSTLWWVLSGLAIFTLLRNLPFLTPYLAPLT